MVIRTPMIEITTIGAGGGSIAWVDDSGLLQVGPESAGSDPGPACYGLGNDRPTVTDASLVLGRINPERPIGGVLERLDIEAARAAIAARIATPLGLPVLDAAEAVLKLANARMAGAIRLVSIERGHDPAKFAAMPFGGGGALHAGALMRDVGLGWALVPRFPGVTSALGCVVADMRHDRVQTVCRLLSELDCPTLEAEMRAVADKTEALLGRAGVSFERIDRQFEFDMLYLGQTHTVAVPLEMTAPLTHKRIQKAFDSAYLAAYGRLLEAIPVRVLNYRVAVTGRRPHFDMSVFAPPRGGTLESCQRGARTIRVDGADLTAPVYERLDLPEGAVIPGPAILEQPDSTVFIDPGLAGRIDRHGNVIIAREGAHATD
jgi:N-methylhydantoinase A